MAQLGVAKRQQMTRAAPDPTVCVVVRTYWAHGGQGQASSLRQLVHSLQRQPLTTWEALLLVMDSRPFEDLAAIVQDLADERVWVFAEWIGAQFAPRAGDGWADGYHAALYALTDEAVRACPSHTHWVVVTNGDNEYGASFFERLRAAPQADVVAFNYYSRYQRPTAPACERFAAQEGLPHCKPNRLRWCQTDLGANAFRWPRLLAENRRFAGLAQHSGGLTAEHYDGVLAQALLTAGWTVEFVHDACLFDHSPTPQRCARTGGVWDDSESATSSAAGGRCLTQSQAAKRLAGSRGALLAVNISLAQDGHLFDAFPTAAGAARDGRLLCLRRADAEAAQAEALAFYGPLCAEEADLPAYQAAAAAAADQGQGQGQGQGAAQSLAAVFAHQRFQPPPARPPAPPPRQAAQRPARRERFEL